MTYVKLNDKVFELISPDIYINQFQTYLNGDTIDFEGLDIQTKYTALERLFDYTCKSFTIVYGGIQDDEPDFKYSPQIADIRARMSSVDRMQKFCKQSGKIEKSIELMSRFMEEMFTLTKLVKEEEKKEKETAIGGR